MGFEVTPPSAPNPIAAGIALLRLHRDCRLSSVCDFGRDEEKGRKKCHGLDIKNICTGLLWNNIYNDCPRKQRTHHRSR